MKLNALASRDAERVVAVQPGQFVEYPPLIGGHDTTRNPTSDHHYKLLARGTLIAVVLLINTVKLQKLVVITGKLVGGRVGERGRNGAGEGRICLLNFLVMRSFRWTILNHKLFTNVSHDYQLNRCHLSNLFSPR